MFPDADINPITLTIAHVREGGNAGGGAYFFDFSPHPVLIEKQYSWIAFEVSSDTPPELVIAQLITSDALGQFGSGVLDPSRRRVVVQVKNTVPYLVQVALLMRNEKTGEMLVCDPQVICRPPPGPHPGPGGGQ